MFFEDTIFENTTGQPYRPVDACQRVVKRFPQMRPYYSVHQETRPYVGTRSVVTNVTGEWDEWNPATSEAIHDPDAILEISRGVPRSFPLNYVVYVLDKIPWGLAKPARSEPLATTRKRSARFPGRWEPSDCITLNNSARFPGRHNELTAHVELPVSTVMTRLPDVPAAARGVLASLGSIRGAEIVAYRSVGEESALSRADQEAARLREDLIADQSTPAFLAKLPHRLSSPQKVYPIYPRPDPIPFKKIITPRVKRWAHVLRDAGERPDLGHLSRPLVLGSLPV